MAVDHQTADRDDETEPAPATSQAFHKLSDAFVVGRYKQRMPRGAARNALDCALWDLESRKRDISLWQLAGVQEPAPPVSAFTISLGEPEIMEAQARQAALNGHGRLKLKLSGEGDHERVAAVHRGAPDARLIVDANESWNDLDIMVVCMLSTSSGIRPAFALARTARWVDLDGPILLAKDRIDGFRFGSGKI